MNFEETCKHLRYGNKVKREIWDLYMILDENNRFVFKDCCNNLIDCSLDLSDIEADDWEVYCLEVSSLEKLEYKINELNRQIVELRFELEIQNAR